MHPVSKILFYHETVHVSGIFCAQYQELSAVHVAIGMFHAGYEPGSNLPLLGSGHIPCMKHTNCHVYSW
jgi:hypothetical protein